MSRHFILRAKESENSPFPVPPHSPSTFSGFVRICAKGRFFAGLQDLIRHERAKFAPSPARDRPIPQPSLYADRHRLGLPVFRALGDGQKGALPISQYSQAALTLRSAVNWLEGFAAPKR